MINEDEQVFLNPSPLEFDRSGRYHVVDGLPQGLSKQNKNIFKSAIFYGSIYGLYHTYPKAVEWVSNWRNGSLSDTDPTHVATFAACLMATSLNLANALIYNHERESTIVSLFLLDDCKTARCYYMNGRVVDCQINDLKMVDYHEKMALLKVDVNGVKSNIDVKKC